MEKFKSEVISIAWTEGELGQYEMEINRLQSFDLGTDAEVVAEGRRYLAEVRRIKSIAGIDDSKIMDATNRAGSGYDRNQ